MEFLLSFLFNFCIFFEILVLFFSFYLKKNKIFFICLALLSFKIIYLYSSLYQANLFISIFAPFLFFVFTITKNTTLVFCKQNISKISFLLLTIFISFILTNNTNFNNDVLNYNIFKNFIFKPISDLSFILFCFEFLFISIISYINKEKYLILAFIGCYLQFLFNLQYYYIEFSSFIFMIYILYDAYKLAFFDKNTNLKNKKALLRYTKGLKDYQIALIHLEELKFTKENYKTIILQQISKKIKSLKINSFFINDDFIILFKDLNEDEMLNRIYFIESLLKNMEFNIENEKFKPIIKVIFKKDKEENVENKLNHLYALIH